MKIEVEASNVRYSIDINNKYTLIRGDSGTGKSTLIDLIRRSSRDPFINVTSNLRCVALEERESIQSLKDCIIFIDEDHPILEQDNISKVFKDSFNFFVIVSREIEKYTMPLAVDSFCKMVCIDGINYNKPLYNKDICSIKTSYLERLIIEDEGSGLEFVKNLLDIDMYNIKPSKGIKNLCNIISEENNLTNTIICYDTLASGWEQDIIDDMVDRYNLSEISWESFESYILQQFNAYPAIDQSILQFNTKERFLTDVLRKYCRKVLRVNYNKGILPRELNPKHNTELICNEFKALQPTTKDINIDPISF